MMHTSGGCRSLCAILQVADRRHLPVWTKLQTRRVNRRWGTARDLHLNYQAEQGTPLALCARRTCRSAPVSAADLDPGLRRDNGAKCLAEHRDELARHQGVAFGAERHRVPGGTGCGIGEHLDPFVVECCAPGP